MKTIVTGVVCAVLGAAGGYGLSTVMGGSEGGAVKADLSTDVAKMNYVNSFNGVQILKEQGVDIDTASSVQGIKDALAGKESAVSQQDAIAAFQKFSDEKHKKAAAEQEAILKKNLADGEAFLAKKREEEGVVALESGLMYKVIKQGDGVKPTVKDQVKVHYHGTLIDGTVFDSSVDRGEPITFGLGRVIQGWQEGVALMPVGSKYEFYIPSDLAYGESGGGPIGPGATLVFDVELLDVIKADEDVKKD